MNRHALFTSMFLLVACGTITEGLGDADETGTDTETGDGDSGDTTGGDGDGDGDGESSDDDSTTADTDSEDTDSSDETTGGDPAWPEPYSLWLFDGDLYDSVGDANGSDPVDGISFPELDGRQGATFGDTGYMLVDNIAQELLGWDEFSIAIRYYSWANDGHATYLSVGAPAPEALSTNAFGVQHRDGVVEVLSESADLNNHYEAVGSVPSINAWHTLVWTFEKGPDIEGTVRYYEDGMLVSDIPYILPVSTSQATVIGGWYGTLSFQGVIDQVALYDRQLEAAEVTSMVGD